MKGNTCFAQLSVDTSSQRTRVKLKRGRESSVYGMRSENKYKSNLKKTPFLGLISSCSSTTHWNTLTGCCVGLQKQNYRICLYTVPLPS